MLCIVANTIIGDISIAISNVTLGLIGFSAYPLFLTALLIGIALMRGRTFNFPVSKVILLALSAVCLILLLHGALTFGLLSQDVSEYIAAVYENKQTAGGIVFGILMFSLSNAFTPVFALVLLGIALSVCLFAFSDYASKIKARSQFKKINPTLPQSFIKGTAAARQVEPKQDTSLFVGEIIKTKPATAIGKGSFSSLSSAPQKNDGETFLSIKTAPVLKKQDAYETLYGSSFITPQNEQAKQNTEGSVSPVVNTKPPKIVSNVQIVLPPTPDKNIDEMYVPGIIINGDEVKRKHEENRAKASGDIASAHSLYSQKAEFDLRKTTPTVIKPIGQDVFDALSRANNVQQDVALPPITNGDYYNPNQKQERLAENESTYKQSEKEFTVDTKGEKESTYKQSEKEFTVVPRVEIKQIPIIDNDDESESGESEFERLLAQERAIRQSGFAVENKDLTGQNLADLENKNAHTGYYNYIDEGNGNDEGSILNNFASESEDRQSLDKNKASFADKIFEIENKMRKSRRQIDGQLSLSDIKPVSDEPPQTHATLKRAKKPTRYVPPPVELLAVIDSNLGEFDEDCKEKAELLEETLSSLNLPAKVSAIVRGPAVTRFELDMPQGTHIKKISQFNSDIAYHLASNGSIRIETPIPGKRAVGIEVPNNVVSSVGLREIVESKEFASSANPLALAIGKDISAHCVVCHLDKMPHLLIAGATGSGKSVCLHTIIASIIYKASPDDARLILIDPKRVEFNVYKGLPHLLTSTIVAELEQAINALNWAIGEMERRYRLLEEHNQRNIIDFNNMQSVKNGEVDKLARIVIIVDELGDLMATPSKREIEDKIRILAQKARASGIHLILATQRPSVDIITGTIKTNLPSRIAFAVTSTPDSRTILDSGGAESLLGKGDMLYSPSDANGVKRIQGAYISGEETATIVNFVKEHNECVIDEDVEKEIMFIKANDIELNKDDENDADEYDALLPEVLKRIIESRQASTSWVQRRFSVGYARASRIIDQLEARKYIGALEGSKPREIFCTREQYIEEFGEF